MLIDESFFIGELNLANTEKIPVREALEYIISEREREILTDFLGSGLYADFMIGLTETPTAKKWLRLLYGDGDKWGGLIRQRVSDISATIGIPQGVQAVSTGNTLTIPAELTGGSLLISHNGIRYYEGEDFTVLGNVVTASTFTFISGQTYSILLTKATSSAAEYGRQSLIANFVYYHYLAREATQTVALGTVATKAENATRVNPVDKMVRAWNEMVDWLHDLCHFLRTNGSDYPNWQTIHCSHTYCGCHERSNKYDYINSLDI